MAEKPQIQLYCLKDFNSSPASITYAQYTQLLDANENQKCDCMFLSCHVRVEAAPRVSAI